MARAGQLREERFVRALLSSTAAAVLLGCLLNGPAYWRLVVAEMFQQSAGLRGKGMHVVG